MKIREGQPCWWELRVDDVVAACRYYAHRFGWSFAPAPDQNSYCIAYAGYQEAAAIGPKMFGLTAATEWATYLHTSNLEDTLDRIRAAGGRTLTPPVPIRCFGRIAVFTDPLGATTGLWEGHGVSGVNPTELGIDVGIVGSRLYSPRPSASDEFYSKVFGTSAHAQPCAEPRSSWYPIFNDSQATGRTVYGPEGETLRFA
nr:VOC family protein [Microbacterium testaceum]